MNVTPGPDPRREPHDPPTPDVSVVMPVLDGLGMIEHSVGAVEASDLGRDRWELLVVDDGSSDGSSAWARSRGHRVVTVPEGPRGPGHARNLGAETARGRILMFVDVDVCVHADALARTLEAFEGHPEVGAVFGAYDDRPSDRRFLSQYRNLFHRWVHLRGAGDAETFWAGCGAVRTELFRELGGFDEIRFPRPQIEDIELGYRIRDAGWRILLDPEIQGTHMKRWALSGMLRTDLLDRGVPWMRLLLESPRATSLNIGAGERIRTALVGLSVALLLLAAASGDPRWLGAMFLALALNAGSNLALYRWLARQRGVGFALRCIPVNILYYAVSGLAVILAAGLHWTSRKRPSQTNRRSRNLPGLASEWDSS